MPTEARTLDAPECPRCGYDLRGETDRWAETCPLESTCPECGFAVRWSVVFGPQRAVPKWSVEHPSRLLRRAMPSTFARTLRPDRFWRSLVMTAHARRGSLVLYAIASSALVTLLTSIPELAIDASFGYLNHYVSPASLWTPSNADAAMHAASIVLAPFGTFWWTPYSWPLPDVVHELLLPPLFVALCPAAYLCLPTTLRTCAVRRTHIARAALLGAPLAVLSFELLYIIHRLAYAGLHRLPMPGPGSVLNGLEPFAEAGLGWIVPLAALQWCWWGSVNRRYLRLPNPRAITLSMLAIAGLATLIPFFAFSRAGVELVRLLGLG